MTPLDLSVDARYEPRVLVPLQMTSAGVQPHVGGRLRHLAGQTMGTTWSVAYVQPSDVADTSDDGGTDACIRAVLARVDAQMSNWREDSDISAFNRADAGQWIELPDEAFHVLETALRVARESGGAYDPSAGPLVDLWGFGPAPRRDVAPGVDEVISARERCGWARVVLDIQSKRAQQPGGISLDLCAIAKGFAVDAVSLALTDVGIAHHLVEIGGELRGEGVKPDGMPWWVELEAPVTEAGSEAAGIAQDLVALHGLSVATSGDYRRFFMEASQASAPSKPSKPSKRYAHTLDPRTGYPASHALASVSVVHRECMLADAWSTALTVLGPQAGMQLATARDIAARFVMRVPDGFRETVTPAYRAMYS
ncbi:FAD:protein FMN transferase [Pandoraea norimbergensis]|uniref:FAD:protein FMN transferase n=1 Tax=Pandoraea norimbergensis TaxID=93219 RepID=A0ABN4JS37_9BURK|nr:FAD:protein FMN transferase [Pandoraea norimbergensis]ALS62699.1 thiamine biosynthesis protein ApbE [Pandoraea norimbergensis]